MSSPINIKNSVAASSSPVSSLHDHIRSLRRKDSTLDPIRQPKILHPIENEDLRLLILENISQEAVSAFKAHGYHVDHYTNAFSEEELLEKIGAYHAIGIRSKTKITKRVLAAASKVSIASPTCHHITALMKIFMFFLSVILVAGDRLFLHWHEPGRLEGSCPGWRPCL